MAIELLKDVERQGCSHEIGCLRGRFHAHLTVPCEQARFEPLRQLCRTHKMKLTVVDLEGSTGEKQQDVMTTSHFRDDAPGAVSRIASQLIASTRWLRDAGYQVVRAKLEHESLPTLASFDADRYHEVHFKLHIPSPGYPDDYRRLVAMGKELGFVASRNPLERTNDVVTQFVNMRLYDGTWDTATVVVERVRQALADTNFSIVEVKRETVVFDTNQNLDRWWISA